MKKWLIAFGIAVLLTGVVIGITLVLCTLPVVWDIVLVLVFAVVVFTIFAHMELSE